MKIIISIIICLLWCLSTKAYSVTKPDPYYDALSESGYNDRCAQKTTPEQLKERNKYWDKKVSPKVYEALRFLDQAPIKPIIEITISKQGDILALNILRSTTDEASDQKAVAAIRALSPFPPLPKSFPLKSDSSALGYYQLQYCVYIASQQRTFAY
jgi:TonB family protein